jgi:hypothetical protein
MLHGPTAAPSPQPTPAAPAESVRAAYRGLRAIGLSESEAGNLSARLAGLGHVRQGWHLREIERLLFIRSLVESGRILR